LHLKQFSTMSKERKMSTRYLIAAALMASACAAHADVLPSTASTASSSAMVQALYDKVSASVGGNTKVSLKQGADGVYVKGLSAAKALALAGDGMSVISTQDGFKIVEISSHAAANAVIATSAAPGLAAAVGAGSSTGGTTGGSTGSTGSTGSIGSSTGGSTGSGTGVSGGTDLSLGAGSGNLGNQATPTTPTANVPEPSTVALMLAGMLGVAGLSRRRSR
jgi:hypothetical protein